MDLALNKLQRLICHKNPPNQPTNLEKIEVCKAVIKTIYSSFTQAAKNC